MDLEYLFKETETDSETLDMSGDHLDGNNTGQVQESVLPFTSDEHDSLNLEELFLESTEGSLTKSREDSDREIISNPVEEQDFPMLSLFEELDRKYGNRSLECFPDNPLRSENSQYIVFANDEEGERVGNVEWCTCSKCIPMERNIESICCREIENAEPYIEDAECITEHEFFNFFCEREATVDIVMRSTKHITKEPSTKKLNCERRKTAYRSFTGWVHGWLGPGNRRPIPACVVNKVRTCFPDPDNEYMGFKKHREYPAEYQAL